MNHTRPTRPRLSHAIRLLLGLLVLTSVASATRLAFVTPGAPLTLDDAGASYAIYGRLTGPGQVDRILLHASGALPIDADVLVPAVDFNQLFTPTLALYGPGINENGQDGLTVPGAITTSVVTDKTTSTTYWQRQSLASELPTNGTFEIRVFDPDNRTGTYVVAFGGKPLEFTPKDVAAQPQGAQHLKTYFTPDAPHTAFGPANATSNTGGTATPLGALKGDSPAILLAILVVAILFFFVERVKTKNARTAHGAHGGHSEGHGGHDEHGGGHGNHDDAGHEGHSTHDAEHDGHATENKNHAHRENHDASDTPPSHTHSGVAPGPTNAHAKKPTPPARAKVKLAREQVPELKHPDVE